MTRILILLVLMLSGPVMADTYFCDSSIRARTLNVTWTECPRHRWPPYDHALYVGKVMDGEFHGRGTYTWEDSSVYIGWWKDGKMNGRGTLTFPNGDEYRGDWSNNQLFKGTVRTDAQNCLLRVSNNYYLPHEDSCFESTGRCCKRSSQETEE
jgi:hypothetical protein